MTHTPPETPSEPYEPHPANLIRDRQKMRSQYGPFSYTRGMYVHGAQTPLKPRNIRIRSSIPIVFAVIVAAFGVWFLLNDGYLSGVLLIFAFAAAMLALSWVGFRTARIREKWERENPSQAKNITY
ncbi:MULTISPECIES: hypothetical protein [Arthrobacter]|uniref:hypothetical protein n=1 Tax=unclassified Arthrobacter TaxID=235627 RepID=UPI0024B87BBF|nr:hypothetical protein [Arthrobacter sp. H35-MC1]MDJ0316996.1 hypothetical protein [Arthrobacter sp. H35-MC1]